MPTSDFKPLLFSLFCVRILHINSARTFGGGERHTADLVNALEARGHELYAALSGRSPVIEELKSLPAERIFELRLRNALDVPSANELARRVLERRIEIVHAHVARDYPLAALAARRGGAQLILTRHLEYPLSRFHRWTLSRSVARVIAVSEAVADSLLKQKIFPPEKIRYIPNGIEVERFKPDASHALERESFRRSLAGDAPFLIGITGELREHKGQEDFVRAAQLVVQSFRDAHFIIGGEDASRGREYRAHLERLVRELDLEGRVHFTGWLATVTPLLHALDVFVSSSRVEPFGLVMVEAMAAGLAVVATRTGGACEIVEDGVTGKLVPVGDVEAMAEAIKALLTDERERRRMGEAGESRARSLFSLDRMVSETEALYREALGAK